MDAVCRAGFGGPNCTRCALGTYTFEGTAQSPRGGCTPCADGTTSLIVGATTPDGCTGEAYVCLCRTSVLQVGVLVSVAAAQTRARARTTHS